MKSYSVWQLIIAAAVLATGQVMAEGDIAAGEQKAASCIGCHAPNGEGSDDNLPISGWDVETFITSMNAYKSGEKEDPVMNMLVAPLSDQDIADLAAYYASLSSAE